MSDFFTSLGRPLLHYLLSFQDDHEFFLCFPFLSHQHQQLFDHPDLHRLYGQDRFQLNERQWQLFSARSWPQLHVPPWKYSSHTTTLGERKRKEMCEDSNTHQAKRWSVECSHLYQHLTFASLYIMRRAPNVTSAGTRIIYRLPRLLRAVIIDRLTSCYVSPIFAPRQEPWMSDSFPGQWFLNLDYGCFLPPSPSLGSKEDHVILHFGGIIGRPKSRSSALMETAAIHTASMWSSESEKKDLWLCHSLYELFRESAENAKAEVFLCEVAEVNRFDFRGCTYGGHIHGLFFGPQLRREIDRRRGGDEGRNVEAEYCGRVEVDLEDSCIIQQGTADAFPGIIFIKARNTHEWLSRGCFDMTEAMANNLADWLEVGSDERHVDALPYYDCPLDQDLDASRKDMLRVWRGDQPRHTFTVLWRREPMRLHDVLWGENQEGGWREEWQDAEVEGREMQHEFDQHLRRVAFALPES